MIRLLVGAIAVGALTSAALAADPLEIKIGYLNYAGIRSTLSLVQQPADDNGVAGARLAIEDNNTTGRFQNQHFSLDEIRLKADDDPAKAALALAERNVSFVIADLPAEALLKTADALRDRDVILFNSGAIDDRLREEDCRANVIHVAPTRSMLADGLAQYLVWKQCETLAAGRGGPIQKTSFMPMRCAAPQRVSAARLSRSASSRIPAVPAIPTAASL